MSCLSFWEAFSFDKTNLDSSFIYVNYNGIYFEIENGLTFEGFYSNDAITDDRLIYFTKVATS